MLLLKWYRWCCLCSSLLPSDVVTAVYTVVPLYYYYLRWDCVYCSSNGQHLICGYCCWFCVVVAVVTIDVVALCFCYWCCWSDVDPSNRKWKTTSNVFQPHISSHVKQLIMLYCSSFHISFEKNQMKVRHDIEKVHEWYSAGFKATRGCASNLSSLDYV